MVVIVHYLLSLFLIVSALRLAPALSAVHLLGGADFVYLFLLACSAVGWHFTFRAKNRLIAEMQFQEQQERLLEAAEKTRKEAERKAAYQKERDDQAQEFLDRLADRGLGFDYVEELLEWHYRTEEGTGFWHPWPLTFCDYLLESHGVDDVIAFIEEIERKLIEAERAILQLKYMKSSTAGP